jgi:hypothetical protein
LVPHRQRGFFQWGTASDPGIIHKDIEAAIGEDDVLEDLDNRCFIGDITALEEGAVGTELIIQGGGGGLTVFLVNIGNDDMGTLGGQAEGGGPSDATRATLR